MATVTLRPNALTSASAGMIIGGGAASHDVAQSDNADATYSEFPTADTWLNLAFGTTVLPALAQIRSVTPRVRLANTGGTDGANKFSFALAVFDQASPTEYPAVTATITTYTGTARSTRPNSGGAWSQADIDNIVLLESRAIGSVVVYRAYESYIDVVTNEAPVATVTAPAEASTITTTSSPTVAWTYSDPESDAQERYQVRITDAADTVTFWDSGEVLSAATSVVCPVLLGNATYVARVRVADVGSNGRYCAYDTNTFTLNVTPPPVPTVVATAEVTSARVRLDVSEGGPNPATEHYVVQYSDNAGASWATLRGGAVLVRTGATTTAYDYEAPSGAARQYRAAAVRTVSGQLLVSANSATAPATLVVTAWWLVDPLTLVANLQVNFHDAELVMSRPEDQATFRPLGRRRVVVMAGALTGEEGALTLSFLDAATYAAFESLRGAQRTLYLNTPYAGSYYVRLGPTRSASLMLGGQSRTSPKRIVTVGFVEVDRPS